MKKINLVLILFLFCLSAFAQKDFYEIRTYEMKFGTPASGLHNYLKDALLPALNKLGVHNIGVMEENGLSQPSKIYLIIPFAGGMASYERVQNTLKADAVYLEACKAYHSIAPDKAPYIRYESSFYTAFAGIPQIIKPAMGSQLFEMRTYEGYSEDAFNRKVKMFNEGELQIFANTGLHSVLFGEKIAGPDMPCLTYMLAFKDMEERDQNWKAFIADPEWKRISALPEYANSVSSITRIFLKPLAYSQL